MQGPSKQTRVVLWALSYYVMRRQLWGKVVFHHIDGSNNQLADWLARVAHEVGKEVDMLSCMLENVTLFSQPLWPFKEAS